MKKGIFLGLLLGLLFTAKLPAQVVSKDSISTLKQEKEILKISGTLNSRKLELAKLENSLAETSRKALNNAEDAKKIAADNSEAADKLAKDPQNKSLARKARKSARSAERNAKDARKSTARLDQLQKDIDSLRKKIADDESELAKLQQSGN